MIIIIIACAIAAIVVMLLTRYVIARRAARRNEAWEGVVVSKDRSSPDGQNMYHYITVKMTGNAIKKIQVRGLLWKTVNEGDKVQKRAGDYDPIKTQ